MTNDVYNLTADFAWFLLIVVAVFVAIGFVVAAVKYFQQQDWKERKLVPLLDEHVTKPALGVLILGLPVIALLFLVDLIVYIANQIAS